MKALNSYKKVFFPGLIFLISISCSDIKESNINPEESFSKIFNNQDTEKNIYPIDIIQTADKGYLIVSEVEERSVRLLKIDSKGNAISEAFFPELKSPMQGLFNVGESYYFFCRDALDYAVSVKVDPDSLPNIQQKVLQINYPLCVGRTSNGFIIQSWNQADNKTIISLYNEELGREGADGEFDIHEEVEPMLNNHVFRKGPRLPFFAGEYSPNQYFVNGYNNYNFNLMFLDGGMKSMGSISGVKTERYFTGLEPISSNNFAFTTTATAEDKNYITSNTTIDVRGESHISAVKKLNVIPEMSLEIPILFKKISANGAEHILCAFTTKTQQIALYTYNLSSGILNGKHLIGYSHPYEVRGLTVTEDGGLAVLAKTQVAGRFPRIALIKFSKNEINNLFGR